MAKVSDLEMINSSGVSSVPDDYDAPVDFIEKIFRSDRKCVKCKSPGTLSVLVGGSKPELYVVEEGIVGRQLVRCIKCQKEEVVVSCDRSKVLPTDQRLRVYGAEVRYYGAKLARQEILHDLLTLLNIAALDDRVKQREKYAELASFLHQKSRHVCEEWCKPDNLQLRRKKFLRLYLETQVTPHLTPSYRSDATDMYKEMHQTVLNSFQNNHFNMLHLLHFMKETLFEDPSRASFMWWASIALGNIHQADNFHFADDKELLERFNAMEIPLGIKKIPIVFILFELPRFYYFTEFMTHHLVPRPFFALCTKDKYDLTEIELQFTTLNMGRSSRSQGIGEERVSGVYDPRVRGGGRGPHKAVTTHQFHEDLINHLQKKPVPIPIAPPPLPIIPPPGRSDKAHKVMLKIDTTKHKSENEVANAIATAMDVLKIGPVPDITNKLLRSMNVPDTLKTDGTVQVIVGPTVSLPVDLCDPDFFVPPPSGICPLPSMMAPPHTYQPYKAIPDHKKQSTVVPGNTLIALTNLEDEYSRTPSRTVYRYARQRCQDIVLHTSPFVQPSSVVAGPIDSLSKYLMKGGVPPSLYEGDHGKSVLSESVIMVEIPLRDKDLAQSREVVASSQWLGWRLPLQPLFTEKSELETVRYIFGSSVVVGDNHRTVLQRYVEIGLCAGCYDHEFDIKFVGAIIKFEKKDLTTMVIHIDLEKVDIESNFNENESAKYSDSGRSNGRSNGRGNGRASSSSETASLLPESSSDYSCKKKKKKKKKHVVSKAIISKEDKEQCKPVTVPPIKDKDGNIINGTIEECVEHHEEVKLKKTARDKFRFCGYCDEPVTKKILVCGGCKKVCYCNISCQKIHWKKHKTLCDFVKNKKELTG